MCDGNVRMPLDLFLDLEPLYYLGTGQVGEGD